MLRGLLYDPSRHGKPRWYVRIRGRRARLKGADSPPPLTITPAVQAAYEAALALLDEPQRQLKGAGSFRWLVEMYSRSKVFERLNELTRRERRSVLGRIVDREQHGYSRSMGHAFTSIYPGLFHLGEFSP